MPNAVTTSQSQPEGILSRGRAIPVRGITFAALDRIWYGAARYANPPRASSSSTNSSMKWSSNDSLLGGGCVFSDWIQLREMVIGFNLETTSFTSTRLIGIPASPSVGPGPGFQRGAVTLHDPWSASSKTKKSSVSNDRAPVTGRRGFVLQIPVPSCGWILSPFRTCNSSHPDSPDSPAAHSAGSSYTFRSATGHPPA